MSTSLTLNAQDRRKWYRISSQWLQEFMELSPKNRMRQLESQLTQLSKKLSDQGFSPHLVSGLSVWVLEALDVHTPRIRTHQPVRILHQLERDYITPEAYGLFLQALRSGILQARDSEGFLEKMANKHQLPIELHQLEDGLATFWLSKVGQFKPQ